MDSQQLPDNSPKPKSSNGFLAILVWIGILGFFVVFFTYLLGNLYNPNQNVMSYITETGQKEVTLIRNRSGHYIADGKINGKPVTFLLDTGATNVSVPETIAIKLGLKRGQAHLTQTANGTITTYSTILDNVTIGNITMKDVRGGINPFMEGDEILLGMSFLKHLELTQRDNTLRIAIP